MREESARWRRLMSRKEKPKIVNFLVFPDEMFMGKN